MSGEKIIKTYSNSKQKDMKSKVERVTARVISVDFENKKIILDFFNKPGFCLFKDVGNLSNWEISKIFKESSVHTFIKLKYYPELESASLSYQKAHPETLKQGFVSIVPTFSGYKNLKKFLFDLIRKENYEENSNDIG